MSYQLLQSVQERLDVRSAGQPAHMRSAHARAVTQLPGSPCSSGGSCAGPVIGGLANGMGGLLAGRCGCVVADPDESPSCAAATSLAGAACSKAATGQPSTTAPSAMAKTPLRISLP